MATTYLEVDVRSGLFWVAILTLASLLATSCGGDEETGATPAATFAAIPRLPSTPTAYIPQDVVLKDLIGGWKGGQSIVEFYKDRTYKLGPSGRGRFQLEGTLMTLTNADDAESCAGGTGIYDVELVDNGTLLIFRLIEDECGSRRGLHNAVFRLTWRG